MKFGLVRPCEKCPFRTDCSAGWLDHRIMSLATDIFEGNKSFTCHETLNKAHKSHKNSHHCAGALIMIEKLKIPNSVIQIAERFKLYNPRNLDLNAPVFKTIGELIDHHKNYE